MRFPAAAAFAGRLPPSLFLPLLLVGGSIFSAVAQEEAELDPSEVMITVSVSSDPECPKEEEGGNVNVVFNEHQDCFKCRKLNAKKDENGCLDLVFTLFNRGVIEVFACPPMNLTFNMTGADTTTPFTAAEISFFTKTANNIMANTPVDLNISGSLDLFSVLGSEALAAWPPDEFPINHSYPTSPPPDWFDQDELLKEEQCPSDESGTAPTPTQAAPTSTFGVKVSPATGLTEPPVLAPTPTQAAATPTQAAATPTRCTDYDTCSHCVENNCAWSGDSCYHECFQDGPCFTKEYMDGTTEEICSVWEDEVLDNNACSGKESCEECVGTILPSDESRTCMWFDEFSYCSTGCDFNGCGEYTCD